MLPTVTPPGRTVSASRREHCARQQPQWAAPFCRSVWTRRVAPTAGRAIISVKLGHLQLSSLNLRTRDTGDSMLLPIGGRRQTPGGVIMAFTKIRETIAAFRPEPELTLEEKRLAQHARQQAPPSEGAESITPGRAIAMRIVLLLVVAIPVSVILSRILHGVFQFNSEVTGIITSAILSFAIASLHNAVLNRIVASVPVRTLSLHFGSKL